MEPVHPEFRPDPEATRAEMEAQQRALVDLASFADEIAFDPVAVAIDTPLARDILEWAEEPVDPSSTEPVVVGIDQAFLEDEAVSAAVALQGQDVIEVACGRTELAVPYIPGLLAFREGGPILAALDALDVDPDLLVFDGNGRIHYRQAGIATHVGVLMDTPAIGIAKNLLCGQPEESLDAPLAAGTRVPILADDSVETEPGTTIGYVVQTRQFANPERRHVNPIYVSPGHRVSAETAAELAFNLAAGYKLPEPIRLADRAAEECKD